MNEAEGEFDSGKTLMDKAFSSDGGETNEARQLYEKMHRKIKKLSYYLNEKYSNPHNEL